MSALKIFYQFVSMSSSKELTANGQCQYVKVIKFFNLFAFRRNGCFVREAGEGGGKVFVLMKKIWLLAISLSLPLLLILRFSHCYQFSAAFVAVVVAFVLHLKVTYFLVNFRKITFMVSLIKLNSSCCQFQISQSAT